MLHTNDSDHICTIVMLVRNRDNRARAEQDVRPRITMRQAIHQFERQGVVVLQLFAGHLQRVAGEMRQVAIKPRTAVDAKVQLAVTIGEGVCRSDTIPRVGMLLG